MAETCSMHEDKAKCTHTFDRKPKQNRQFSGLGVGMNIIIKCILHNYGVKK